MQTNKIFFPSKYKRMRNLRHFFAGMSCGAIFLPKLLSFPSVKTSLFIENFVGIWARGWAWGNLEKSLRAYMGNGSSVRGTIGKKMPPKPRKVHFCIFIQTLRPKYEFKHNFWFLESENVSFMHFLVWRSHFLVLWVTREEANIYRKNLAACGLRNVKKCVWGAFLWYSLTWLEAWSTSSIPPPPTPSFPTLLAKKFDFNFCCYKKVIFFTH